VSQPALDAIQRRREIGEMNRRGPNPDVDRERARLAQREIALKRDRESLKEVMELANERAEMEAANSDGPMVEPDDYGYAGNVTKDEYPVHLDCTMPDCRRKYPGTRTYNNPGELRRADPLCPRCGSTWVIVKKPMPDPWVTIKDEPMDELPGTVQEAPWPPWEDVKPKDEPMDDESVRYRWEGDERVQVEEGDPLTHSAKRHRSKAHEAQRSTI